MTSIGVVYVSAKLKLSLPDRATYLYEGLEEPENLLWRTGRRTGWAVGRVEGFYIARGSGPK